MGNFASSKIGGIEVPVSDEHPWGVNSGIKMPIPLDFANEMRKNGTPKNIEYRKFLGYKLYQWIPHFINSSESFNARYNEFVESIFSRQIQILDKIQVAQMDRSMKLYLSDLEKRDIYIKESNKENYKEKLDAAFKQKWSMHKVVPLYAQFPQYFINMHSSLLQRINSLDFQYEYAYDDNNNFLRFMGQNETLRYRNKLMPDNIVLTHFINVESNNKNQLLKIDVKNEFTIIPITEYSMFGGHALTIIANHRKKILYIMDSNGSKPYLTGLSNFVKERCIILKDYTTKILLPIENGPSFQTISQDDFCQTWTIFLSLLAILNTGDLSTSDDINTIVYNEIIKYTKPLVGPHNINEGTKLGLIVIEFMYYMYSFYREEVFEYGLMMTKKESMHLTQSDRRQIFEDATYKDISWDDAKQEYLDNRKKLEQMLVPIYEQAFSRYKTSVQPDLIKSIVQMDLPPRTIREIAKAIRDGTL